MVTVCSGSPLWTTPLMFRYWAAMKTFAPETMLLVGCAARAAATRVGGSASALK